MVTQRARTKGTTVVIKNLLSVSLLLATTTLACAGDAPPPADPPATPPTTAPAAASSQTPPQAQDPDDDERLTRRLGSDTIDPRYGLLTPLPANGGLPPIVDMMHGPTESERASKILARKYTIELRRIRMRYFGSVRDATIRQNGVQRLREFADPASFQPMIEILQNEAEDVQEAMLDHFDAQAGPGQGAMAWAAIHAPNELLRARSLDRLTAPAAPEVLAVLDGSLRSGNHRVANNAGLVAGALHAIETIPLLILGQTAPGPGAGQGETGDIAWIAFQTQNAYVQGLVPIVGDNSGAFQPIIGVVTDGTVLRIQDAVAIIYRTYIHESLINMTSYEWGKSTEPLGYDRDAWLAWYNQEFVPYVNAKRGT